METSRLVRTGVWLVALTMLYNAVESVVALWAGIRAESVALVGFGLDSVIELLAATVVLWRMSLEARGEDAHRVEMAERRVHRFVGATFFALAAYVMFQAAWRLWTANAPNESVVGIVLAVLSLIVMPLIALAKLRVASAVNSPALRAEAKETLACSYLSFCLLLGLVANASLDLWWADPVAALLMVPWLVLEGTEASTSEGD